jgi:type II secretory pathway predicted ATPase ExeA
LEALANSITVTIAVEGLCPEESISFIENRLSDCGARSPLFTKNALTLIHQSSGGILRTIGTVANAALLKAFVAKSTQVEAEHVQSVVQR